MALIFPRGITASSRIQDHPRHIFVNLGRHPQVLKLPCKFNPASHNRRGLAWTRAHTDGRGCRMCVLLSFIILPPSLLVKVMSFITLALMSNGGLSEAKGQHVRYSKFLDANSPKSGTEVKVASRIGMLIAYTPALTACIASFAILSNPGQRCLLLSTALSLHFFKRVFEVLFVHRYSGAMVIGPVFQISISYGTHSIIMIYAQHLAQEVAEPMLDLKYPGVALFLLGITGNYYHHCLLSRLRGKDDKGYKIPKGGLFRFVICPHYLFEIIEFVGMAFISQTIYAFAFTWGSMVYLMGRSYATRKWYLSKFPNFPTEVRAVVPYVF